MSTEQPVERQIAAYLEREAPSQVADRLLTTTFDRTRATRQVSARRWRFLEMSPIPATFATAAAAFAMVVVAATVLLVAQPTSDEAPGVADLAGVCPMIESAHATAAGEPPLGVAIVCLDGAVGLDLGLPPDAWTPDLSPEGSRVAFRTDDVSIGFCGACRNAPYLAVQDLGDTDAEFLTHGEGGPSEPAQFAWSPDGRRIAYQAVQDDNLDIYVLDLDESEGPILSGEITRLTTDVAIDEFPSWTPDGSTIIYENMGVTGPDESGYSPTQEIWSVPASGGTPTRLTRNDVPDTNPDVAADGTVAFWRDGAIWTMDVDGAAQAASWIDLGFAPRWSPDGSKLAVLRYDPSERTAADAALPWPFLPLLEVMVVDLESREVVDVGPRVATDLNAVSWTPDGEGLLVNRYDDGT